jgi:hypothetical protein
MTAAPEASTSAAAPVATATGSINVAHPQGLAADQVKGTLNPLVGAPSPIHSLNLPSVTPDVKVSKKVAGKKKSPGLK